MATILKSAKATATAPATADSIDNFIRKSVVNENDARFGGLCRPEGGFQKKLAPSSAVIKQSHVVNQKRVLTSAGRPDERLPNPARPFDKSDGVFFHIRSNSRSDLVGLGVLRITAACEGANKRGPEFSGKTAGPPGPIIKQA